ncbi:MAG: TMEM175 family protein [Solirubrobacterales bacterium]
MLRIQHYAAARVEQFSDGVVAIAITLLVLQITVPSVSNGVGLLAELKAEWPSYLAYVISFLTIGGFWLAHHTIFSCLRAVSPATMKVNLLLMMAIAFLPFPTAVMANDILGADGGSRVAVVFYGLSLLLCRVLISWLWWQCRRDRLIRDEVSTDEVRRLTRRLNPGIAAYAVAILVAAAFPSAGPWLFLVMAIYAILITRTIDFYEPEEEGLQTG